MSKCSQVALEPCKYSIVGSNTMHASFSSLLKYYSHMLYLLQMNASLYTLRSITEEAVSNSQEGNTSV